MELRNFVIYIVGSILLGIIAAFVTQSIFVGIALPILMLVGLYLRQLMGPIEEEKEDSKEVEN